MVTHNLQSTVATFNQLQTCNLQTTVATFNQLQTFNLLWYYDAFWCYYGCLFVVVSSNLLSSHVDGRPRCLSVLASLLADPVLVLIRRQPAVRATIEYSVCLHSWIAAQNVSQVRLLAQAIPYSCLFSVLFMVSEFLSYLGTEFWDPTDIQSSIYPRLLSAALVFAVCFILRYPSISLG